MNDGVDASHTANGGISNIAILDYKQAQFTHMSRLHIKLLVMVVGDGAHKWKQMTFGIFREQEESPQGFLSGTPALMRGQGLKLPRSLPPPE